MGFFEKMKIWGRRPNISHQQAHASPTEVERAAAGITASILDGRTTEASKELDRALSRHPSSWQLQLINAKLHRLLGRSRTGLDVCDQVLCSDCDSSAVFLEKSRCHIALSDLNSALDSLQIAVIHNAKNSEAWYLLGETLLRLDRFQESISPLQEAINISCGELKAHAWYQLGQAMHLSGRPDKAAEAYSQCLELIPHHRDAHIAMGHAKLFLEEELVSLQHYEKALKLGTHASHNLRLNMAAARQNCGQYDAAREAYDELLLERPNDHTTRWYLCQLDLLQCRWVEGWANHPARFAAGASPYRPMPYQPWRGHSIPNDTLLVLADQGIGDEILFASCLPDLQNQVAHRQISFCIVECEPRLLQIFQRSFPKLTFTPTQRENNTSWLKNLSEPQWQIASGDLPGIFRRKNQDFPNHSGYLSPDPTRVRHWKMMLNNLGPNLKVGISWRGGTSRTRTLARSIQPRGWRPILTVPGVNFVNLQYGDYADELSELNNMYGKVIYDFPEAIQNYDETAALVSALDLVITVCTAIVHLSGGLGQQVWILTPHSPGWRYTADRTSMPWYPSSRIFRQPKFGDWDAACQSLSDELLTLTKNVT